ASSRPMPEPSSRTRTRRQPPSPRSTSMRRAPASSAFSTSSLTAAAGRSTTSPAAIWLASVSASTWMRGATNSGSTRIDRARSTSGRRLPGGGRDCTSRAVNARLRFAWLACCVLWGSTWSFIKLGLRDLPPLHFAAGLGIAGVAVLQLPSLRAAGAGQRAALGGSLIVAAAMLVALANVLVRRGFEAIPPVVLTFSQVAAGAALLLLLAGTLEAGH